MFGALPPVRTGFTTLAVLVAHGIATVSGRMTHATVFTAIGVRTVIIGCGNTLIVNGRTQAVQTTVRGCGAFGAGLCNTGVPFGFA